MFGDDILVNVNYKDVLDYSFVLKNADTILDKIFLFQIELIIYVYYQILELKLIQMYWVLFP